MSKETQPISLDKFLKMTEEDQQKLSTEEYVRLTSEKHEHETLQANLKEAEKIKAEHYKKIGGRAIFLLEVDGVRAWLTSVDRKLMSMVASVTDPIEQAEVLLENLWITGDERLKNDDEYFLGAINQLKSLMHVKVGALKKF